MVVDIVWLPEIFYCGKLYHVIASEAKQSSSPGKLDCFALRSMSDVDKSSLTLRAMTVLAHFVIPGSRFASPGMTAKSRQFTPMKSRLPISTPLWRRMPWAMAAWK